MHCPQPKFRSVKPAQRRYPVECCGGVANSSREPLKRFAAETPRLRWFAPLAKMAIRDKVRRAKRRGRVEVAIFQQVLLLLTHNWRARCKINQLLCNAFGWVAVSKPRCECQPVFVKFCHILYTHVACCAQDNCPDASV